PGAAGARGAGRARAARARRARRGMMRAGLAALALALPAVAAAHPLGNFTVNRYAALRVEAGMLSVRYVVDMAEIPAYQEIAALDRNRNGALDPDEPAVYPGPDPGEVVADAGEGLALADSSVPRVDRSQALRAYPADLLQSPPQVSEARLRITSGSVAPLAAATPAGALVGAKRFGDRMTELVSTTW